MTPSEHIDALIAGLADWRGRALATIRETFLSADPQVVEEWKWMGSPTWSRDGIIAVANAHKRKVKITFSHGAELADPEKIFNAGLGGNAWRAIDISQGDRIDELALRRLVQAAIAYNQGKAKKPAKSRAREAGKA